MIFQPVYDKHPRGDYFAYVQPFCPVEETTRRAPNNTVECFPDPDIGMFRVKRVIGLDGEREGMIIKLTDIWREVDLVPNFGEKCPRRWTTETAVEKASDFIVNHFHDKDIYASLAL